MPLLPSIVRQRQRRRLAARRSPAPHLGAGSSLVFSLLLVAGSVWLALFYIDLTRDLPSPGELPALLEPPDGALLQPTRLVDRTGEHLFLTLEDPGARSPSGSRQYLPFDPTASNRLPESLARASVATADPEFWRHPGFTLSGVGSGAHPTLAQRLVSDLLLWNEPPGLRRDLRERLLAAQITARFGRNKVMEWYLNSARFGRWIYGADAAARAYFDKPASSLSLAEAALLAAVAEAPEINPLQAPQEHLETQKQILKTMLARGMISESQARQAGQERLLFRKPLPAEEGVAVSFTSLALEQLSWRFPLERLERGGLLIRTSLDEDLQAQASCAAYAQINRSSSTPGEAGPAGAAPGSEATPCEAARLLPTLPLPTGAISGSLSAQVVILDPQTGQLLAMVGDAAAGTDPSHKPGYAPGTLLSPFIYLAAFTRGWSPASLVWDIPSATMGTSTGSEDQPIPVGVYHGPVSLRTAFANDYLAPALEILSQIGPGQVWRTAQELGLESLELAALQNIAAARSDLSGGEATLLELGQAFGAFASQGFLAGQLVEPAPPAGERPSIRPVTVIHMEDTHHQVWLDCQDQLKNCTPQVRPVVSPQLAYLITHVLSDEIARWPSLKHPNPLEIGRPAAAKIGQTRAGSYAWTVGYTPQLVVGVWFGKPGASVPLPVNSTPPGPESPPASDNAAQKLTAGSASALWHALIQYASRGIQAQNWPTPAGISTLQVCDPSGMLPTSLCPSLVSEVFLTGNEPTHSDTLYRLYQVNRETGRLATVFTPPELVEERVYLTIPPQAQAWARTAGLAMPPVAYDVVSLPQQPLPSAQILSPGMFTYVRGITPISGTASGGEFAFYRIQAGKGLNPQEWLQIGEDARKPVKDGVLGRWDTRGLNGLYALQLLVVRKDQRIDTAVIQVTVDNQAPQVTIVQPEAASGRVVPGGSQNGMVFEAAAEDDLGVAQVEFFLDGEWLAALREAPYLIAWKAAPGKHTLRVRVVDLAGNAVEADRGFEVSR